MEKDGNKNMSKQIKSKKRVANFGEVFTAEREVKAMCDLIPDWTGNILEPACGNGNFLVEIAKRKLEAGLSFQQTAETIYAVDIMQDNVDEAINRLLKILPNTEHILRKNIVCGDFLKPSTIWFLKDSGLDDIKLKKK